MSATIYDIAQKCGVTPITVKRVLNSRMPGISEETRTAVLAEAKALGYNSTGRTHRLGLLYIEENTLGLTHPFFGEVINAFKCEAENLDCEITFIGNHIVEAGETYLDRSICQEVDGVCVVCTYFDGPETQQLIHSDMPCVTIDYVTEGIPAVTSDNEFGMRSLVDYAFSMGHKRIAFIHGQTGSMVSVVRIDQFKNAMAANGLEVPENYLCECKYGEIAPVRTAVAEMLALPEPPTCILLPDDTCYFGAQEAAMEADMRIPSDISFAGYDGIALTQALRPQLTTIRQDCEAIGKAAARSLLDLIEHPDTANREPVRIPVELLRGSTVGWCNIW